MPEIDLKSNLDLAADLLKCADGDNSYCLRDVQHHCRQRLMREAAQVLIDTSKQLNDCSTEIGQLKNQLAESQTWTAVTDGLPGDQLVLVTAPYRDIIIAEYHDGTWYNDELGALSGVTHWMPLPKGPEE